MALIKKSPRRRVASAGQLRRSGDAAAAVEELASVLTADPEDVAANVEMARSLIMLEDAAGAEEHYRRALAAKLDFTLVIELAHAIASQKRKREAFDYLDAAEEMTTVEKELDVGEVWLARAMIHAGSGKNAEAREALAKIPETSGTSVKDFARRMTEELPADA